MHTDTESIYRRTDGTVYQKKSPTHHIKVIEKGPDLWVPDGNEEELDGMELITLLREPERIQVRWFGRKIDVLPCDYADVIRKKRRILRLIVLLIAILAIVIGTLIYGNLYYS